MLFQVMIADRIWLEFTRCKQTVENSIGGVSQAQLTRAAPGNNKIVVIHAA
jgi:hypothetical protein